MEIMREKHRLAQLMLLVAVFCATFTACRQKIADADYQVVPLPKEIALNDDVPFALTKNTVIYYDEGDSLRREAEFLAGELGREGLASKAAACAKRVEGFVPDPHGAKAAAAMLALSGLRDPKEMFRDVLGKGGHSGVSTFYGYYMLEAMSAAGENARALETVRDYWGGMLDMGATSFWEDFDLAWTNNAFRVDEAPVAGRKDIHGDFGAYCYVGFRHSLCHGWSSGPAPWLIEHVLGIRPLDVGCRSVEVSPFLGDLEWAEGAMALPGGGKVSVRAERAPDGKVRTKVDAPPGVACTVR